MRATAFALLLLPAVAASQVDLTPSPVPPLNVEALHILQRAAGPGSDASPAVAWCVADTYRMLAEQTENPRVAAAARTTADQYDRLAAHRLALQPRGLLLQPGQEVVVPVRHGIICRTRARVAYPIEG